MIAVWGGGVMGLDRVRNAQAGVAGRSPAQQAEHRGYKYNKWFHQCKNSSIYEKKKLQKFEAQYDKAEYYRNPLS